MITAVEPKKLSYWVGGEWRSSRTDHYIILLGNFCFICANYAAFEYTSANSS